MEIQDLTSLDVFIKGMERRSHKIRLITLFRNCRAKDYICYIGDYPLIWYLVNNLHSYRDKKINRWEVLKVINNSDELKSFSKKDKSLFLNGLCS